MRKLFLLSSLLLFTIFSVVGREKQKVTVSYATGTGKPIIVILSSPTPFIRGSNIYVLHIGNRCYSHGKQSKSGGKGSISYKIPATDYNLLNDGTQMYLTYGQLDNTNPASLEKLANESAFPCWELGLFKK